MCHTQSIHFLYEEEVLPRNVVGLYKSPAQIRSYCKYNRLFLFCVDWMMQKKHLRLTKANLDIDGRLIPPGLSSWHLKSQQRECRSKDRGKAQNFTPFCCHHWLPSCACGDRRGGGGQGRGGEERGHQDQAPVVSSPLLFPGCSLEKLWMDITRWESYVLDEQIVTLFLKRWQLLEKT